MTGLKHHIFIGDNCKDIAIHYALTCHYPEYENGSHNRTRISIVIADKETVHDFVFEYQELFDNSYWRIVDLTGSTPRVESHRPQYEGRRKDFVDVEWEFVIGHLSNPILQEKLKRWANDTKQQLSIALCYKDKETNERLAEKLKRRLPDTVSIEIHADDAETETRRREELMGMAKYLHYFYKASYELNHVPTEFPEEEVDKAWNELDERMKMSNLYNVMSIPHKMKLLGHDRDDWNTFYALTAAEIEQLTAVEHNRWSVERLIQGFRPCTDAERLAVEEDLRLRLSDSEYAKANPVSLKQKYKTGRNAHYDLCAFSELGVDETGLSVTRYDRDLTAAIPLIVKTFSDRHKKNG